MKTKLYFAKSSLVFTVVIVTSMLVASCSKTEVEPADSKQYKTESGGRTSSAYYPSLTDEFKNSSIVATYNSYAAPRIGYIDWSSAIEGTSRDGYPVVRVRNSKSAYVNGIKSNGKWAIFVEYIKVINANEYDWEIYDYNEYGDILGKRIIQDAYVSQLIVYPSELHHKYPTLSAKSSNCYKKLKEAIENDPVRDIICSVIDHFTFDAGCKFNVWLSCQLM